MTSCEYAAYQAAVAAFMGKEGISSLVAKDEDEPAFSLQPCDCCRRPLGGYRYPCSGYNPTTKEVQHYENVCPDCVYYDAFGRLDDRTMSEIQEDQRREDG